MRTRVVLVAREWRVSPVSYRPAPTLPCSNADFLCARPFPCTDLMAGLPAGYFFFVIKKNSPVRQILAKERAMKELFGAENEAEVHVSRLRIA